MVILHALRAQAASIQGKTNREMFLVIRERLFATVARGLFVHVTATGDCIR